MGERKFLKHSGQTRRKPDIAPRERILKAACELFYSRGIRPVTVDEIAEAARTNKMTLYRHFTSKDLLVAEYLRSLAAYGRSRFEEAVRAHPGDAYAQLRAYVARVGDEFRQSDARGCPIANAAVELPDKDHPARVVIEECKREHRAAIAKLCRKARFVEPKRLADEIHLLFEGACVDIQISGKFGPGARFGQVALALMNSHSRHSDSK